MQINLGILSNSIFVQISDSKVDNLFNEPEAMNLVVHKDQGALAELCREVYIVLKTSE